MYEALSMYLGGVSAEEGEPLSCPRHLAASQQLCQLPDLLLELPLSSVSALSAALSAALPASNVSMSAALSASWSSP